MKVLNSTFLKSLLGIAILLAVLGMTGCASDGPMESAGEEVDEAAEEVEDSVEDAADEIDD